jgi:hypothetical protein
MQTPTTSVARRQIEEEEEAMKHAMRVLTLGAAMLCATQAWAVDPAVKCQASKLKAAAKYTTCRFMTAASAARSFLVPDYSRCDASFESDWAKAEQRALSSGSPCWSTDDAAAVQAEITAHTDALAAQLAGDTGN